MCAAAPHGAAAASPPAASSPAAAATAIAAPPMASAKKQVGKYEIGRTLGEGTFGKVFLALNERNGELFACKQLVLPADAGVDELRELRF